MNTKQNTILRLAVAAAFMGGVAGAYAAPVDLSSAKAVKFASELPTTGLDLFNAGDLTFSGPVTNFTPSTGQNLQVNVTLSNGAVFSGNPTLTCNVTTAAGAGNTVTGGIPILGGNGTTQAIYNITQTAIINALATSGTLTTSCMVSASAITVASGAHTNINATITYTYGTVASSTVNGAIITFVKGVSAWISGAPTLQAEVTAGFTTFTNTATVTAQFGQVFYMGNGAARIAGTDATAAAATLISATDVLSSGAITANGGSLAAAATTGGVFLTSGSCTGGTVLASAGPATSVTFAGLTPAELIAGPNVCLTVNGTSAIPAETVTASLAGTPNTNYSVNTTLSPNILATITRNGASARALNIPNVLNSDQAFIRITNTGSLAGNVTGTLYDQTGAVLGTPNALLISAANFGPQVTVVLDAPTLKTLFGITSDWAGRAQLVINASTTSIAVVNAIRSANGTLTNLSSKAQ